MSVDKIIQIILYPGILFVICLGLLIEWIDRKFLARLQNRYGPIYTDKWGILQPLTDLIKLLSKEDIEHEFVDLISFRLVPLLMLTLPLTAIMCIPLGVYDPIFSFEGDLVFVLFIMTMNAILTFIAGWSSTNRFSIVGAVRTTVQLLGYEVPLTVALICPSILTNTISIRGIANWQMINLPLLFLQPIGFFVAFISFAAELELVPFDIPIAETEIVAGWKTEFSGRKLGLIRLSKNVKMVLATFLLTSIYLMDPIEASPSILTLWFIVKVIFLVITFSIFRASFARFRIDQMIGGSWKYLLPISLIQVMLTYILKIL